jgi:hypothetical protein
MGFSPDLGEVLKEVPMVEGSASSNFGSGPVLMRFTCVLGEVLLAADASGSWNLEEVGLSSCLIGLPLQCLQPLLYQYRRVIKNGKGWGLTHAMTNQ